MNSDKEISNVIPASRPVLLNTPNLITLTRFALSIVVFSLMSYEYFYGAFWAFIIAASTDWIDGYIARSTGQVTQLGRILDPFCDKIIICGTYILVSTYTATKFAGSWHLITGWMAVVVVGRELLVTVLRGYIEQHGGDFSANMAGKLKMVFQCVAVGGCLLVFALQQSQEPFAVAIDWITGVAVWIALISTVYSGVVYIFAAMKMLKEFDESSHHS